MTSSVTLIHLRKYMTTWWLSCSTACAWSSLFSSLILRLVTNSAHCPQSCPKCNELSAFATPVEFLIKIFKVTHFPPFSSYSHQTFDSTRGKGNLGKDLFKICSGFSVPSGCSRNYRCGRTHNTRNSLVRYQVVVIVWKITLLYLFHFMTPKVMKWNRHTVFIIVIFMQVNNKNIHT